MKKVCDSGTYETQDDFQKPNGILKSIATTNFFVLLTIPVIYAAALPTIILDFVVSLYQYICFPIYKIKIVKRNNYIVFDRHYLPYLNVIGKMNCLYCSYMNGFVAYTREIFSLTEKYWCPIKHKDNPKDAHEKYDEFFEYQDGTNFREKLQDFRDRSKDEHPKS